MKRQITDGDKHIHINVNRYSLCRIVCQFPKKLKIEVPCNSAIPLLGIYPNKTIIQKDTQITMFIEEIFSITKTWNPGKGPLTDEHIKKKWSIYTVEYYSLVERSGFHLQQHGWMFSSVQFSRTVMSGCLWPHGLQHTRLPCLSPTPGACSNSCPSSLWCHPNISSFIVPFSSCL